MVAVPEPDTLPRRKPGQRHGPTRRCPRPAERREGQVDEELAGTGRVKHRPVDGEQHDVGGRDVQRHPVKAGRLDERCADDLVPVHAGVRDHRALREVTAVVGVAEGEQAHDRQRDARRPPAGLQHQQHHDRPDDHVDRRGHALPTQELVESASAVGEFEWQHRVETCRQRHHREQPVDRRRVVPWRRGRRDDVGAVPSDSTTTSTAAPPPGTRSVRPGCPARAERTPGRSRTARPVRSLRPPRGVPNRSAARAGFSSS